VSASGLTFSSRFHWDSRPNPLTALLRDKRSANTRVLDLTESNPTHAGLTYPHDDILGAFADARALRYDPDPRGMLSAREAVSRYYAGRGAAIDPARVILTASTSEAYAYLFKLLTNPGDEVLVPRPSYPLFEYLAAMESVAVRQYPLPNNPTGSFLKRDEWTRLSRWASARNIAILSDEVFSDFAFAPDAARVSTLADAVDASVFAMSGLSKIAGLPQMKLGWIVANGPGHVAALDGLEWIADTFLSVATPVQLALDRLLTATETVREQIRQRAMDNLATARSAFGPTSSCRILHTEGGWYVVIQIPGTRSEEEWTLGLLQDADVLVQPGFFYDFEAEAYLVVSLLTEPAVYQEGIRRISEYVETFTETAVL
jgi:alanine-synthesizing transaminase